MSLHRSQGDRIVTHRRTSAFRRADTGRNLQLAQSLALSSDLTDADRSLLIDMLHELSKRRRNDPVDESPVPRVVGSRRQGVHTRAWPESRTREQRSR
jgi:hypothetical protein